MPLRLRGGLPRLAQSSLSLLATGRTASLNEAVRCLACMSGPMIPDARNAVTGHDANQARVAVLLIADFISPAAHAELGALS
jgi:hypothetical protein